MLHTLTMREQISPVRDGENRIVAFTDGAACNPEDPRRRRAAWGVYYAPEHSYNMSDTVKGELQTVYRAELQAVEHVLKTATTPTRIVSDCQSVVNQLTKLLQGGSLEKKSDHADLWASILREIKDREESFFEVEWINSHIDTEKAQEVEAA